jgi:hypothetical protein
MTGAEIPLDEGEVMQAIEAQTDALWEALFRGDAPGAAAFWTSDGEIVEAEGWFVGNEIERFLGEFFQTGAVSAGSEVFLEWFFKGDLVYTISLATGTYEVEGQVPFTLTKYCTKRWVQDDGLWKMKRTVNGRVETLTGALPAG